MSWLVGIPLSYTLITVPPAAFFRLFVAVYRWNGGGDTWEKEFQLGKKKQRLRNHNTFKDGGEGTV